MKCPECEKLEFVISELTKQLEEEREEDITGLYLAETIDL